MGCRSLFWRCPFSIFSHRSPAFRPTRIRIGIILELSGQDTLRMLGIIFNTMDRLGRFQKWFDSRFGWFFTNGMKSGQPKTEGSVRA